MSQYAYRRPSRFNLTTIVLVAALLAGAYLAWKFVPVYWTRYKVDEVLTDVAFQAIDLRLATPESRSAQETALTDKARERITALGIDPETLSVYFEPDMSSVHADYAVVVNLPVLAPKVLEFRRIVRVPGDDKVP